MAGAYCRYCDHRCFVTRTMPADARWMPGQSVHLATCARGKAHDREGSGYDADTAINPALEAQESGPDPDVCANPDCDHQRAFHFAEHDGLCFGPDCDCCEFEQPELEVTR